MAGDINTNVIDGGAGNDTISGGGGNDTLYGGAGTDVFFSYLGSISTLDGGAGIDKVDYSGGNVGIVFDLSNWVNSSIKDTLISIEIIMGSTGADTFYAGGASADTFLGGWGNDVFYMDVNSTAPDYIDGVLGNDKVSYAINVADRSANFTSVAINYSTNSSSGGALNDSFFSIEQWELSSGNDSFTASSAQAATVWGGCWQRHTDWQHFC